ncbi:ARF/SAR type [Hexamita inflata]|uniref:ARF/SAR type n=1 Tax=Hexamita inflata TaxID=28002 RepID=A0AA86NVT8_9EUKA|nr:ARF/SAR type [Hexamita inflata]
MSLCKKDTEVRVVMLGLDGSGKTSLLYQWISINGALNELVDTVQRLDSTLKLQSANSYH